MASENELTDRIIGAVHAAQQTTYLRLSHKQVGLLINFDVAVLKDGLKRVVNHYDGPTLKFPLLRDSAVTVEAS